MKKLNYEGITEDVMRNGSSHIYVDNGVYKIDLPLPKGVDEYYASIGPSDSKAMIIMTWKDLDPRCTECISMREYTKTKYSLRDQFMTHLEHGTHEYEAVEKLMTKVESMRN